jgi:hypothetical protein
MPHDTMKLRLTIVAIALAGCLPPLADAQIIKPIDYKKDADVNNKSASYGDLQFDTISQPTRDVAKAPIAKGDMKLQGVDLNQMNLQMLDMSTIPTATLPKANFTAKRATVDKMNDQSAKQLDQTKQKAPVTEHQIRAFAPGGEDDLKKQLNEPH